MPKRPTVYDVAREAGVSTATVSYAYHKPERVGRETLEGVMRTARELGYVPRSSARDLAVGRQEVLGLFAFDMLVDASTIATQRESVGLSRAWGFPLYVDEVQRGFQLGCAEYRKFALIGSGRDSRQAIDVAGRVDGLAILPGELGDNTIRQIAQNMPVVLLGREAPVGASYTISVDNRQGINLLVEHLIEEHALHDIQFLGPLSGGETGSRFELFRDALRVRGLRVPESPWAEVDVFDWNSLSELRTRILRGPLPQAFVCAQDQIAGLVTRVVLDEGRTVPGDVSVVGFDGIQAGQTMSPRLTTIRQPMEEMGRTAVKMLLGPRLSASEREVVFAPTLVASQSCGCDI